MSRTSAIPTVATIPSRLLGLDLLRLLALALVLGRHMEPPPAEWQSFAKPALAAWQDSGALGVDLFFVLSGFLVSGLLFAEYKRHGDISIKRFYIRRAWKIYPSFYTLIAFSFLYATFAVGYKIPKGVALAEVFFFQNYCVGFWNHTWSLAVEEHFYIALPLLLLFLIRKNRGAENPFQSIPLLVAAASLLILVGRTLNFALAADYSYYHHVYPTHIRVDALFFGTAIAYAHHFHRKKFHALFWPCRHEMIIIGSGILASFLWFPNPGRFYLHTVAFTQYYLGSAMLLVGVLMCKIPTNRFTSALGTLGAFSYPIYLWHMVLMYWAIPQLKAQGVPWGLRTTLYMAGAFVIGISMAKLVELPTLHLRDRFFPSRTQIEPPGLEAAEVNQQQLIAA